MTQTSFGSLCTVAFTVAVASVLAAQGTSPAVPDQAALATMTARFAPTDITADVTRLPAGSGGRLESWCRPAGSSTRCSSARSGRGTRRCCCGSSADTTAARTCAPPRVPGRQGPVVTPRSRCALHPRRAREARGRELLSRRRHESGGGGVARRIAPDERRRATGFFTTIRRTPPGSPQPFVAVPYSLEYQGELARAADCSARLPRRPRSRR